MIKLIATDLDNTLLNKQGNLPKSTLDVIHRATEKGVHFAVATGRSFNSANRIADMISMDAPVICYNGSLIKDASDRVLYEAHLSFNFVRKIIAFARERGIYVQLYDNDVIVVEKLRTDMHPDPDLKYTEYVEVGDFDTLAPIKTPKMLLATSPNKVPKYQRELEALYGDRCFCAQSDSHLIEIMPKGVDKGRALKRLAKILGVKPSETMAMGDNTNDILLLKAAGLSVAVANSVPELKTIADYVCAKERSQGCAEAIKKFVL